MWHTANCASRSSNSPGSDAGDDFSPRTVHSSVSARQHPASCRASSPQSQSRLILAICIRSRLRHESGYWSRVIILAIVLPIQLLC